MDRRKRTARTVALMSLFTMTDIQENVSVASFDGDGSELVSLLIAINSVDGCTETTVTRTGKNLLPHSFEQGSALDTIPVGTRIRSTSFIPVKSGKTYCLSANDYTNFRYVMNTSAKAQYPLVDNNFKYCGNDGLWKAADYAFTATKDGYLVVVVAKSDNSSVVPSDIDDVEIQVEIGSTATAYEPYQGETYTITFPAEAGTVHDATLDVTNGKLTVSSNVYDTNPVSIQTLIGTNNIWADTGEIKYIEYNV